MFEVECSRSVWWLRFFPSLFCHLQCADLVLGYLPSLQSACCGSRSHNVHTHHCNPSSWCGSPNHATQTHCRERPCGDVLANNQLRSQPTSRQNVSEDTYRWFQLPLIEFSQPKPQAKRDRDQEISHFHVVLSELLIQRIQEHNIVSYH